MERKHDDGLPIKILNYLAMNIGKNKNMDDL